MVIKTERLILRKWTMDDAKIMYLYCKDPDVGPIAGWPPHKSIEESKLIISHFLDHHPYCYAICKKDDINNPIGCIELKQNSDLATKEDEAEIGYWLGKPHWGNGYMPEAGKALIDYGFTKLGFNFIWGGYYEGNYKSMRVQEKLGFSFHHKSENIKCSGLDEYRVGYVNLLTKEAWVNKNNQ